MVTLLFIGINVVIFILMGLSGVSLTEPSTQALLNWGGLSAEHILEGEWWRLFSCLFVHIGIVHLLMNMYVLYSVGSFLEPFLGKLLFFIAYIVTGVLSSLVSFLTYKGAMIISAGASGAIAGIFGTYVFVLLTPLIPTEIRRKLLTNALYMIGVNVICGLSRRGIDHAAHLGGLASGFTLGILFYPLLSYHRWNKYLNFTLSRHLLKRGTLIGVPALTLVLMTIVLMKQKPSDQLTFTSCIQKYGYIEEKIQTQFKKMRTLEASEDIHNHLSVYILPEVEEAKEVALKLKALQLDPDAERLREVLISYIDLFARKFELVMLSYQENTLQYDAQIRKLDKEMETLSEKIKRSLKEYLCQSI